MFYWLAAKRQKWNTAYGDPAYCCQYKPKIELKCPKIVYSHSVWVLFMSGIILLITMH